MGIYIHFVKIFRVVVQFLLKFWGRRLCSGNFILPLSSSSDQSSNICLNLCSALYTEVGLCGLAVHQTTVCAFHHPWLVSSQVSPEISGYDTSSFLGFSSIVFWHKFSDTHMEMSWVFFFLSGYLRPCEQCWILSFWEGIFPWNSSLNTWVIVCCFRGARCWNRRIERLPDQSYFAQEIWTAR